MGDEQQARQQDLGLRQPEVHAALDATTGAASRSARAARCAPATVPACCNGDHNAVVPFRIDDDIGS
jgi:hypothetical protein